LQGDKESTNVGRRQRGNIHCEETREHTLRGDRRRKEIDKEGNWERDLTRNVTKERERSWRALSRRESLRVGLGRRHNSRRAPGERS
jgi:hypothetical protein